MTQTTKASKQFPILNKNRHGWMRGFLFSYPESDWLRQIPAGCALYSHLLLSPTHIHPPRPCRFTDGVFACLPSACGSTNTFFEIAPIGLRKVVRWWVKHRLWDRLFGGSKLRQQGRLTIFGGWLSPTISPISLLHSQESGLVARQARCFAVSKCTHFSARKP